MQKFALCEDPLRLLPVRPPFWTATARHADIVLPPTMSIERDDFGSGQNGSDQAAPINDRAFAGPTTRS